MSSLRSTPAPRKTARWWTAGAVVAGAIVAAAAVGCAGRESVAERARPARSTALPMTARHLPEGCDAVAHFALEGRQAEGPATLATQSPAAARLAAQALALGAIDVDRDITHVAVCLVAAGEAMKTVFVAGGTIPGAAVVPALQATEPGVELSGIGGVEVAAVRVDGRRWLVAQAADGTIVIGDDERLVGSALPPSARGASLPIAWAAPLSVTADGAIVALQAEASGEAPLRAALAGARRLAWVASPGPGARGGAASLRVGYADAGRAAEAAGPLRALLEERLGRGGRVAARTEASDVVVELDGAPRPSEVLR